VQSGWFQSLQNHIPQINFMFRNHLTIAFRNLFKRKGYTLLNMLGLAIGISCCLLIFQYVSYERNYDKFETQSDQTYRIRLDEYKQGNLEWKSATSYPGIAPGLKRDYPEVENYCRLIDWNGILANPQTNSKFNETKGYYADPSALNMLSVHLLKGNAATALQSPNDIVISEATAKKYFGSDDALGKQLQVRAGNAPANLNYLVTGVFKDYPNNSHLIINYLVSWATLEKEQRAEGDTTNAVNTSFGWYDFYSYIQLKKGTDPNAFQTKLTAFCNTYINSQEWNKTNNVKNVLSLIPLSDIHLYSNYNQEAEVNGSGEAVAFMFLIAFFIMGIAWINYINLATARSVERAKEVGVRKVLGAMRNDLIRQFMMESALLNITALIIAFAIALFVSPMFNIMMGRDVSTTFHITAKYTLIFTGIFVFGTLLSGLYPAFVLSGYKPVIVLKGAFKNTSGGLVLRKSLIVLQFAISVILIVGTIIVYQQVNYMRNQKLGANINQTLVLNGAQSLNDSMYENVFQSFKNDLLKIPAVKSIAASTAVMGQEIYWTRGVKQLQSSATTSSIFFLGFDYDFIPQYQLKLVAGRSFSKDFPVDALHKTAILNEQAVKVLGFKDAQDAINKKIVTRDTFTIVGVTEGYHHLGLQKPIDPQVMLFRPDTRNDYSIKLQPANMQQNIAAIQKVWNVYFPNDPFNYFFLDDFYNQQYKADQQFGEMFTLLLSLQFLC